MYPPVLFFLLTRVVLEIRSFLVNTSNYKTCTLRYCPKPCAVWRWILSVASIRCEKCLEYDHKLDLLPVPLNFKTNSTLFVFLILLLQCKLSSSWDHLWISWMTWLHGINLFQTVSRCAEWRPHLFWFTERGWQIEVLCSGWWGEGSGCSHHRLLFPPSASGKWRTWENIYAGRTPLTLF